MKHIKITSWFSVRQKLLEYNTKYVFHERKNIMSVTPPKLKLCSSKDNIHGIKRLVTDWEELLINHVSYKELVCKIYNNIQNSIIENKYLNWK